MEIYANGSATISAIFCMKTSGMKSGVTDVDLGQRMIRSYS
ncbi:unnamed protein product [Haemonchus placei]|uniref:Transposase n=1 Tax=Haemonchus placei TaxID=6290 RepID=A0A0N4WJJ0_HAEPC|nr:unnamed protein product [Haemonchus placei]